MFLLCFYRVFTVSLTILRLLAKCGLAQAHPNEGCHPRQTIQVYAGLAVAVLDMHGNCINNL